MYTRIKIFKNRPLYKIELLHAEYDIKNKGDEIHVRYEAWLTRNEAIMYKIFVTIKENSFSFSEKYRQIIKNYLESKFSSKYIIQI